MNLLSNYLDAAHRPAAGASACIWQSWVKAASAGALGEAADSPTPPTINMTPALHGAVPDTPSPQAVACVSKWEPGFSLINFWRVSFTIDWADRCLNT